MPKNGISTAIRNGLLTRLKPEQLDALRPHFELVPLPLRHVLYERGDRLEHAYFPQSGMVSLILRMEEGDMVEVGTVGSRGMAGVSLLMGGDTALHEALVQAEGEALSLPAATLTAALEHDAHLRRQFGRYQECFHFEVAQTAACNASHHLDQRLARWLLMARHRIGLDELPLTHELLAMMFAVRRAGVTVATGSLERAGFIRNRRGRVTILDVEALEEVSCECYRLTREKEEAVLG
jgi:CRP-like cAMP-binding protein